MKEIIEVLTKNNETISTMESCTGGYIVNAITNIEGASEVIKYSAITYSNEYKIKMGVPQETIDKYTVYSIEVANEMSKVISKYTDSDYGIGITGKLNRVDKYNPFGEDNIVYISIYNKKDNKYHNATVTCTEATRALNKELVLETIIYLLKEIIKKWLYVKKGLLYNRKKY